MINLTEIMKKVTNATVVLAAGVALMNTTDVEKPLRKKVLMDALNSLEGEFKVDLSDQVMSILIEVILAVGKFKGVFGAEAKPTK